jgi:flagellum-specific peptidoglycan hydrolase FlgJ
VSRQAYFDKMRAYAQRASTKTGIPVAVILGQWAHETAYGTSDLVKRGSNNHGGIKYVGASTQDGQTGMYAKYSSLDRFVDDYSRVMLLSYYDAVRKANGIGDTLTALSNSPYAEDKQYGEKIAQVIKTNGLGEVGQLQVFDLPDISGLDDASFKKYAAIGFVIVGLLAAASTSQN